MYIFVNLLILCLVIFFYIHINSYRRPSNYLEIYELVNPSKQNLEDIFNYRQPVLIKDVSIDNFNLLNLDYLINNYYSFDINIHNNETDNEILLNLRDSMSLFENDISSSYISYNNINFMQETTIEKNISNYDIYFRPVNTTLCKYDFIIGTKNSSTKLKSELFSRNYFLIISGKIEVTLIPPKYNKFLHLYQDYTNLETKSKINIENIDSKYSNDYSKTKSLKITLEPNEIINIPHNWFYSIKVLEDNTLVYNLKYRTLLFNFSIFPEMFLSILQKNNSREIITKIINFDNSLESNKESL